MVILGTTVLREMSFVLEEGCKSYHADSEETKKMNKIVAKKNLKVTSTKLVKRIWLTESINIKKAFITGHDCAKAVIECERILRNRTWPDPDHCFFEGFCADIEKNEVVCWRWGS